jgi:hypothetical protein
MDMFNYGMTYKIVIPTLEMPSIIESVSDRITVKVDAWKFTGELLKVTSKKIKDENGEPEILKELTILIDSIAHVNSEGDEPTINTLVFPNKKEFFIEDTTIEI